MGEIQSIQMLQNRIQNLLVKSMPGSSVIFFVVMNRSTPLLLTVAAKGMLAER